MLALRLKTSHLIAFVASATASRASSSARTVAFSAPLYRRSCSPPAHTHQVVEHKPSSSPLFGRRNNNITQQRMSFFGGADEGIPRINRDAMKEIIEDVANSSREESGYVIIDVRGEDEIQYTGKLDEVVETLPLPYIAQGALAMDDEDFKDQFGFDKPGLDETIVFSCKAGIRSQQAGQLAKMAGYSDILDYMGGSNEWFS